MKKILLATTIAVLAASIAVAKPPKEGGPAKMDAPTAKALKTTVQSNRGKLRAELYKKLKLTDVQRKKIDAIDAKYKKESDALRAKGGPTGFQAMRELMEKRNKEIMGVLDKNQKKTYEAEMKKWQDMRWRGPGGIGGPGPMGRPTDRQNFRKAVGPEKPAK